MKIIKKLWNSKRFDYTDIGTKVLADLIKKSDRIEFAVDIYDDYEDLAEGIGRIVEKEISKQSFLFKLLAKAKELTGIYRIKKTGD